MKIDYKIWGLLEVSTIVAEIEFWGYGQKSGAMDKKLGRGYWACPPYSGHPYLLYQTVAALGFIVFFFYTQWTFVLVLVYFGIATLVSIRGCTKPVENESDEKLGFLEHLMQIIYQTSAGAVMLTDIVFWCLLLPFMLGESFQLTLLIGSMHSVNAVFLILESALNRMPFTWFGLIYFILWSCSYVVFQWAIHACCVKWYLALALVHIPFYGLYVWLTKAKHKAFSTWFPNAFMRFPKKKEI
ncbi:uncharacterized protein LOC121744784 isoform X2 [Salvia splendens]|uniref:uncharacterized protein LOC121744784 isoform X2 n=1 Tax=Salvia splendens TaxID=180675 RepID=UPI001C258CDC|nr:uncharacterized protein LOC121744784 isoform X2 [Salvia splendens]